MKRLLGGVVAVGVLLGVGVAVVFGLFAHGGGEQMSGEALAVGLYGQDVSSGPWNCDDMGDIVNPPRADEFPPVAAMVEAEDLSVRVEVPGSGVASVMAGRAKEGRPYADEKEALSDSEDGVLLYIAIVRKAQQDNPELVVSEDEARAYLRSHPPGPCESGGPVRIEGVTDSQLVRGIQIQHTTTRFVQGLINSSLRSGVAVDQTIADMIAQARPTVKITEVAFGPAGGLECTEDGAKVDCPPGLPTPTAAATPPATP